MLGPTLIASLARPRYEIVPMKGVDDAIAQLPPDAVVTVTASPRKGVEDTLDLAAVVAANGHEVVPHLAARMFTGRDQLESVLDRLASSGVREVFVIAGDLAEPAGPYEGAAELLEEMSAVGHGLERVGISGYPEAHAFIPDRITVEAMDRKLAHATHIVSQICYDPDVIRGWVRAVRARGVGIPIVIGLPGVVDRARLLKLSLRVGLGDSVRFLGKHSEVATRMLAGFRPEELMEPLGELLTDPTAGVAGWHVFTFNEVGRTEGWRRRMTADEGARL